MTNAALRGILGAVTEDESAEPALELLSAEQVGEILNPERPLTAASARKEMTRAGIGELRGYPAALVRAYAATRPGKGGRREMTGDPHDGGHITDQQ